MTQKSLVLVAVCSSSSSSSPRRGLSGFFLPGSVLCCSLGSSSHDHELHAWNTWDRGIHPRVTKAPAAAPTALQVTPSPLGLPQPLGFSFKASHLLRSPLLAFHPSLPASPALVSHLFHPVLFNPPFQPGHFTARSCVIRNVCFQCSSPPSAPFKPLHLQKRGEVF